MKLLRRRRRDLGEIRADNILWGVPRREGYSDTDDPLVHEGLVQHAFLLGEDDQALCGIRPPHRLSRADKTPRPQLALAGPANPRCPKCEAALAAGTIGSPSTFVAQARPEQSAVARPDESRPVDGGGSSAPGAAESPPPADVEADGQPADDTATSEEKADRALPDSGDDHEPAGAQTDSAPAALSADEQPAAEQPAAEQPADEPVDLLVPSHPSRRVRRGGLITIPAGRQSVLAELPASAHGAAIAAEIDGGAGQVRVQSVALNDDGTLRVTLNQPTVEPIDVIWFVV